MSEQHLREITKGKNLLRDIKDRILQIAMIVKVLKELEKEDKDVLFSKPLENPTWPAGRILCRPGLEQEI